MRVGFYPGSFDPVTLGHLDIIRRALNVVDRLVIGIGTHAAKKPLFTSEERTAMLSAEVASMPSPVRTRINVAPFEGLAVAAAKAHGASIIVRGVRDGTDLDLELQMGTMNAAMEPEIMTVFLAASPEVRHIAASLVRQIAVMGGDVSPFVSKAVAKRLAANARAAAPRPK